MNSSIPISHSTLHKKAVVSMDDGTRVGYVADLLIDPQRLRLAALVVKGDHGQSVLPIDKVLSIGDDAITVEGMSATQSDADKMPGVRPFSEFHNQNVVDNVGSLVGQLHDLDIDAATARIVSLQVHEGGVFGIGAHHLQLPVEDVYSFGPDLITVNKSTVVAPV